MNRLKQLIALCALATVANSAFASNTTAEWSGSVPGVGRLTFSELAVTTLEVIGDLSVDSCQTTDVTFLNGEIIANGSDGVLTVTADDNASEVLDVQWRSSNTSIDDTQTLRHSFWGPNSTGNQTEFAYIDLIYEDVTTATEDGSLEFGVVTNDTLAAELKLTGAALYPATEGGLTLGATGYGFGNAFFNGTITATTGTATFGAIVVNTSIVPDTDGGATLGASGTGLGNVFINGNTVTTGTVTIGASSSAITNLHFGQVDINNSASSGTVALTDIDANDAVILTPAESIATGTLYVQIEAGTGFDVVLEDGDTAASTYTISYIVLEN